MTRAAKVQCPECERHVTVRVTGAFRDHLKWVGDIVQAPRCPGSGWSPKELAGHIEQATTVESGAALLQGNTPVIPAANLTKPEESA